MKLSKVANKEKEHSNFESLSHGNPIEVLPEEIIFKDIQINQTYEITVYVRNLTKMARRIRVFQPKTSKFRADYDMQGAIAAGLAIKLVITFETSILEEFHDSIKIVSDGGFSIDVPLHAFPPSAGIIFEPFINLGFVRVNKEKAENIQFKNEGKSQGKVELKFDKLADFRIEPTNFILQPNQEFQVKIFYRPKEAGIFRGLIEVTAEGNPLQKTIDINATSIEFTRFFIDENGSQSNQFDFGTTYYGQQKKIETYLVNNTPKQQKFKVKIKQGIHQNNEEAGKLQTPSELGQEQLERIIDCFPEEGVVESYSQIPIIFRCSSKVNEKQLIWTRQYSMSSEDSRAECDEFNYSAIFEFLQDPNDTLITHLTAKCICPTIKFPSSVQLQFGVCASNSHKDILFQLKNTNNELPIEIHFPTIPYFSINPQKQNLEPNQQFGFWASFKPKHTGSFQSTMMVELLDGVYKVPIKLNGSSNQIQVKQRQLRGPECGPDNFLQQPDENRENSFSIAQIKKKDQGNSSLDLSSSMKSLIEQQGLSLDRIKELKSISLNKDIYNSYIKKQRNDRLKQEKDKNIKQKYTQMNERLKELGITSGINDNKQIIGSQLNQSNLGVDQDDEGKADPPIDYEFAIGMINHGMDEPKLSLPESKNPLYVTKPIDNYEPIKAEKQIDGKIKKSFNPDSNTIIRKKFPEEPKTHSEIRDTTIELTSDMLQKIDSGPVKIDYGHIFLKSKVQKTFLVRNELRNSISVRLHSERQELSQSYFKKQIIPSGQIAGFDVVLQSHQLGQIRQNVKYIINERHIFEFQIQATIEPVQLEVSRQQIKFAFSEDNIDLETIEPLRLTNNGNAAARFKFLHSDRKIFLATPEEGEVPAGQFLDVKITYHPSQTSSLTVINQSQVQNQDKQNEQQQQQNAISLVRNEDEKLTIKVFDGIDQSIKCSGMVNEPKCSIKQTIIDLKEIAVCKQETKPLTIKNHSRTPAVYHVLVQKLPENVEVTPSKGKILSEESKDIQIQFYAKDERTIKGDIMILIRGGRILKLPFTATTVIPKVEIIQDSFNFGNITTLGNSITLKMTVTNNSNIPSELILDLRTESENSQAPEGIECLEVKAAEDADESLLLSVHDEEDDQIEKQNEVKKKNNENYEDVELDAMAEVDSDDSEPVQTEAKQFKLFNITLLPNKSIHFNLRFSPKEVRQYAFNIPLTLARYGKLPSLTRQVLCRGLKPKFLIEPQVVEFKKKIISTPDKCFPTTMEITLSNPDKRDVNWKIDNTSIKSDKIFEIEPIQGIVGSREQIKIKVKFNPYGPGQYQASVPLFILSDPEISASLPYVDIQLSGQGSYPRLLFDKKEVILPVVPLNTMARCTFRILNDGYENLNLIHKWGQEVGNFHVDVKFPEGKNLGITRSKLKVEILFINKKPLSFTTRLEFIDEARVYSINISGTTDNCLFTNFAYLQRQMGEFKIICDEKKPIMLVDDDEEDNESIDLSDVKQKDKKSKKSVAPSVRSSKSNESKSATALGYTPIRQDQIEESCDAILRWLNYHVLTQAIQSFPTTIIEHNGNEIFDLLTFLTGKSIFSYKVNIDQHQKRLERAELMFKQYDELIRQIKIEGGLLNHIRPEYLLSYQDYLAWLKSQPQDKFDYVPENLLRLTIQRFQYICVDSWISLFYQILKIYYLGRITPKMLKSVPGVPIERTQVPDYYIEGSNMLSANECTLLWWYEVCYEITHPLQSRRLGNFSTSFQDCQMIASTIQQYVGQSSLKLFQNLRVQCLNEDDYKNNAEKIIFALSEVGLQSHITVQDLIKPQQREMLLFLIQIFFALPHYIPKSQPILFQCVLGEEVVKSIDLTNPTQKSISYWAKYEGHADFVLEGEESFKIEPKQTYKYKIKFTSRISQSVNGRVIFTNKKETNIQAAALVFELKSQITGRRSERQWNVSTALYELFEFPLAITNKFQFADQGEFFIQIIHEKVQKDDLKQRKKQKSNKKKNDLTETTSQDQISQQNSEIFPSFFCRQEKVRIKKGQQIQLQLQFLPLTIEQHKCYIIFTDPNVGEFQHEVYGTVEQPNMIGDIKPDKVLYVDSSTVMNFEVPYKNEFMMRARRTIEQMIQDKLKNQKGGDKNQQQLAQNQKLNFPGGIPDTIQLECDIQPITQYLTIPPQITLIDISRSNRKAQQQDLVQQQAQPTSKDKKSQQLTTKQLKNNDQSFDSRNAPLTAQNELVPLDPNANKLSINYAFKNPVKDFNVQLTMRNQNKTDIRRYRIIASVLPKIIKSILEFRVPARQSVTQDIPIINNSEREWNIRVNLQTEGFKNGNLFSCPLTMIKEFQVKKKSTGVFPLTFSPIWVQVAEARLVLQNPITNDVFEYELKGIGEEPVAEDHIILNCQARKITKRDIEIQNPHQDRQITYKVETDLINATGAAQLTLGAGKKGVYILQVCPVLSGQYTGSITFTDDEGRYLWYTVFLSTESPKSVQTLDLQTVIRQTSIFTVTLANPLDQIAIYEVIINGEGLIGEQQITVQPQQKDAKYDLLFQPLRVGRWRGSVAFISQLLGEVWYELSLSCEDQAVQRLNLMKASLGKVESQIVTLDNPSDQRVVITSKISNPSNFDVVPEEIIIPPKDSIQVQLHYTPSSLDIIETSEIIFNSPIIGKWTYLVFGQGLPPTKYPTTTVSIGLNKDYSSVIHFKNPFKEPIQVSISLYAEGHNSDIFKLLLMTRKKLNGDQEKTLVPGMNVLQIPFSFVPREITCYYAEVIIAMNDKIQWQFPLKGITESVSNQTLLHFKSRCREQWEDEVKIPLNGLVQSLGSDDRFDFEIGGVQSDLQNIVKKCFTVNSIKNYIENPYDNLLYFVRFIPMKPFKTSIDFVVLRQSGGRWKFKIQLEATEPQEDDHIVISSALNKTTSVSFKLTNKVKSYARFTAGFNSESDAEFSVMPKQGDLEPYGREGTTFIISFTPVEYGKIRKGKLIIQTEDMFWSYSVRGVLPRYDPPQAKESLIDDKMELQQSTMVQKNFLMENIRKSKNHSPPSSNRYQKQSKQLQLPSIQENNR